jgi:hypothetical protein
MNFPEWELQVDGEKGCKDEQAYAATSWGKTFTMAHTDSWLKTCIPAMVHSEAGMTNCR